MNTPVTYLLHNNQIHEFIFAESSREALDVWFEQVERIILAIPPNSTDTIYILINTLDSGTQPLAYAFMRGRKMIQQYPNRPPTRVAFLDKSQSMLSVLDAFLSMIDHKLRVRYFLEGQREQAIDWLLQSHITQQPDNSG